MVSVLLHSSTPSFWLFLVVIEPLSKNDSDDLFDVSSMLSLFSWHFSSIPRSAAFWLLKEAASFAVKVTLCPETLTASLTPASFSSRSDFSDVLVPLMTISSLLVFSPSFKSISYSFLFSLLRRRGINFTSTKLLKRTRFICLAEGFSMRKVTKTVLKEDWLLSVKISSQSSLISPITWRTLSPPYGSFFNQVLSGIN